MRKQINDFIVTFNQIDFVKFLKNLLKNKYLKFCIIAALFVLIVISRRVDVITYPQFYAEDGVFWYSEAYNANSFWEPFLIPKQGYFQTISRIGGLLGSLVDIRYAPLIMNLLAIAIQISPALFFLSNRFKSVVPSSTNRMIISLGYLMLPGTFETHANLTNAMWRLALLSFLIVISSPATRLISKIFDFMVLLISGISGPFIFFLFPLMLSTYKSNEFRINLYKFFPGAVAFLIQIYAFIATFLGFYTKDVRSDAPLGASIMVLFKLISGKIFIMGIFGMNIYQKIIHWNIWSNGILPTAIFVLVLFIFSYAYLKSKKEIRLFIIFSLLILLAGMATPQVSLADPQWVAMLAPRAGNRYFLFPIMALLLSIVVFLLRNNKKNLYVSLIFIGCISIGIYRDWTIPKYKNYNFNSQVLEFEKISAGDKFNFTIVPNWHFDLTKK